MIELATPRSGKEAGSIGERVFGPDGVIARNLPGYESRKPQQEMADLCEQVIAGGGTALVEAGTGTGKSLAYLVPAIESGEVVVVSTESIQLQEQLVRKDLPFLERALGRSLKFAIAKGRRHYLCERNTVALVQEVTGKLPEMRSEREVKTLRLAEDLLAEFQGDWDGNRATLALPVSDLAWSDFEGDDSCTGSRCPHAATCPYLLAKAKFEQADVIVTNHHYYLLHHYVKERSGEVISLLPEHRIWIADEAHTLADIAQNVYGLEIHQGAPRRFVTKLLRQLKALKLELDIDWNVPEIETASDAFFDCFRGALKDEQLFREYPDEILAEAERRMERLVAALRPIRTGLHKLAANLIDDPDTLRALRNLKLAADGLIDGLQSFFRPTMVPCRPCAGTGTDEETDDVCEACDGEGSLADPDPPVLYAEVTTRSRDRDGKKHVTLHRKPAETQRIFKGIFPKLHARLFTSATLAVGGSFGAVCEELGLKVFDVETLQAKSPFDYTAQVRGYFPRTIGRPDSPTYHDDLADEIQRIVEWTGGRAFILFTANRDMRAVRDRLILTCPYPVLTQGEAPKDLLIEQFRQEPSVLLGVRTFWTGVDIPGQALSCVVLVKFPFPQPEAPLVKARCERIEARYGPRSSFEHYSLPRAIRDIQQGFGRLIRSRTDRGLFAILDPRWHSTNYARKIERSLPQFPRSEELPTDWSLDDEPHLHAPDRKAEADGQPEPVREGAGGGECAAGAAGSDQPANPGLFPELPEVAQPVSARPDYLHEREPQGTSRRARAYDRRTETGAVAGELAGRSDVGCGLAEAPAAPGADGGDRGCPGGAAAVGADHEAARPARWRYLVARTEALYLDCGFGVGPLLRSVTDAEVAELRDRWTALWKRERACAARNTWLATHPEDADHAVDSAKADEQERRLAAERQEFAAWLGVTDADLAELIGRVLERETGNG
ncbi:MAG TPA: ATP-dependent DNA helicase [Armatimonadota bacterium]|nr:ATP-dependent DNA helicase [Armatimonadota bacterium]